MVRTGQSRSERVKILSSRCESSASRSLTLPQNPRLLGTSKFGFERLHCGLLRVLVRPSSAYRCSSLDLPLRTFRFDLCSPQGFRGKRTLEDCR
jgi:hypothetical protein